MKKIEIKVKDSKLSSIKSSAPHTDDYHLIFEKKKVMTLKGTAVPDFNFKIVPLNANNHKYDDVKEDRERSVFKSTAETVELHTKDIDKMHMLGIDTGSTTFPDLNDLTYKIPPIYAQPVIVNYNDSTEIDDDSKIEQTKDQWILSHSRGFPNFINQAFKKFKLVKKDIADEINCDELSLKAFPYQLLVREYMKFGTPNRGLLVHHGLGAGKTRTAIITAETYRKLGYKVLVLTPAFLKENFIMEILKWGEPDLRLPDNYKELTSSQKAKIRNQKINKIRENYYFVSTNATGKSGFNVQLAKYGIGHEMDTADSKGFVAQYLKEHPGLKLGPPKKMFIIMEEAHNIIRTFAQSKAKIKIYDLFLRAEDCKFLLLSGSGIISNPFETATLINLLTGTIRKDGSSSYIFPRELKEFQGQYYNLAPDGSITINNESDLLARLLGRISYYRGVTHDDSRKIFPELHEMIVPEIYLSTKPLEDYQDESSKLTEEDRMNVYPTQRAHHYSLYTREMGVLPDPKATKATNLDLMNKIDLKPKGDFRSGSRKICNYYIPERELHEDIDLNFNVSLLDITTSTSIKSSAVKLLLLLLAFFDEENSKTYQTLYLSDNLNTQLSVKQLQSYQELFKKKVRTLTNLFTGNTEDDQEIGEYKIDTDTNLHLNILISLIKLKKYQPLYRKFKTEFKQYFNDEKYKFFINSLTDTDRRKQILLDKMSKHPDLWLTEEALSIKSPKMLAILQNLNNPIYGAPHLESGGVEQEKEKDEDPQNEQDLKDDINKTLLAENPDENFNPDADEVSKIINEESGIKIDDVHVVSSTDTYDHVDQGVYENKDSILTKKSSENTIYQSDEDLKSKGLHVVGGPALIYSEYKVLEGVGIMKLILEHHGYEVFKLDLRGGFSVSKYPRGRHYALITGDVPMETRVRLLEVFNAKENMHGQLIRVLLITSAGSEGINLFNIRQVHIMEPFWDRERIRQTIGRSRRLCSHKHLPYDERIIYPFSYIIKYPLVGSSPDLQTADQWMEEIAERRDELNKKFLKCFHRSAIDAELNLEYNHDGLTDSEKASEMPFKFDHPDIHQLTYSLNEVSTYNIEERYKQVIKIPMMEFKEIVLKESTMDLLIRADVLKKYSKKIDDLPIDSVLIQLYQKVGDKNLDHNQILLATDIDSIINHFRTILTDPESGSVLTKNRFFSSNLFKKLYKMVKTKEVLSGITLNVFKDAEGNNIIRCQYVLKIESIKGRYKISSVDDLEPSETVVITYNKKAFKAHPIYHMINLDIIVGYFYQTDDSSTIYLESDKVVRDSM